MGKIRTNLLYNVTYQILILIVPLITTPYVSRVLLPEGVGTYSITTTIAKYFWMFAQLGMSKYGNRSIAKAKGDKKRLSITFWNLVYFQIIVSMFCLFVYFIYIYIWGYNQYGVVIICQIPYVLAALFEISWFFYGTEQFKFIVKRNIIIKILTALSVFLFVKDINDVWIYALINSISLILGQLCLWPFVKKYVNFEKPNKQLIKSHFKPNFVLFVSVIAVSIYTLMDKIMIEIFSSTVQLGYYENSHKIMEIGCNVVGAIGAVMLPRVSYLMENNDSQKVYDYLEKSMRYIMILAIAITFGMAGIGKEFAIVYFGNDFAESGLIMMAISPAIIFYSLGSILRTQYLIPGNKDKIFVKATVFASIINVLLNVLLIKNMGALGAAIGTVGALIGESGYETIKIRKEIKIGRYIRGTIPFFVFGLIMFTYCRIISNYLKASITCLIIQIVGGGIVYALLTIIYLIIKKDEMIMNFLDKKYKKINI